jgi:L-iditol 2-dehydrogenase
MKAAILYGPKDVRLEEIDIPPVGPGEVLVKIESALTCGTDAKVFLRGGHPKMITPPAVFGHEFAGEVVKTGNGVERFRSGMKVAAANSAPCNRCFYCRRGKQSLCEDLLFINGAYAQYISIPSRIVEQNLHPVPENVSSREASLVEPLACALHGIEEANIGTGDTVVINGAGPIGLMFIQLAKLKGARVISCDIVKERLSMAEKSGADEIINVSEVDDEVEYVRKLTGGFGVDVGIEAVGSPAVWEKTVSMVRKGGTVVLFGGCAPGTKVTLDTELIHYGELTLKGVFHHTPYYIEKALKLLHLGRINTSCLITGELPLGKLEEALNKIVSHQGVKTAIIPW